ncbi:SulP family inorganic anion transporter [Magnetovibrio sp. PR-2]|uniref:SLC26A/SulP transporter family protein n=1 Tax=Magnetovibrio sp. PR-2 TaxID=3120356 RepID=UPI002FCE2EF9
MFLTSSTFKYDLGAAFVGALTTLPQAVAYGLIAIAPLGPEWAMFGIMASVGTSVVHGALAGAWGPNRFLISGAGAVTALVMASAISAALSRGYSPEDALVLSYGAIVIAGLAQWLAGQLRLGRITSYVPVPVFAGFGNASALLVIISALPTVLGQPDQNLWTLLFNDLDTVLPWAAAVGGVTILVHLGLEGRIRLIPAALIGLAAGTAVYYVASPTTAPLIGHLDLSVLWREPPLVFPMLDWLSGAPNLQWRDADIPIFAGLSMALLASFYTVITSSALALSQDETIDSDHELRVYGAGNVLMGVLGFLPSNGSPSRSNAVVMAGAKTRAANWGSALAFLILVVGLAPIVKLLPLWATAGMLVASSLQAIDRDTLDKLFSLFLRRMEYPRLIAGDLLVTVVVVVTALTLNLIAAVGLGVFLSVALFVLGMGKNPIRRMYRGSRIHSKIQRPAHETKILEQYGERIGIIEIQGALFFGSTARLISEAQALLDDGVEYLILDFKHLSSIDSTGTSKLRLLSLLCDGAGGKLMISYVQRERRAVRNGNGHASEKDARQGNSSPRWIWLNLKTGGIVDVLGENWIFADTDTALARAEKVLLDQMQTHGHSAHLRPISTSPLFDGLSRQDLMDLGQSVQRRIYRKGEQIFAQGEDAACAYFLARGRMNIFIDIPGASRKKRISTLMAGSLFGEMGLIDGEPRSASVVASRDSVCYVIDTKHFSQLRQERPDLVVTLMSNVAKQFSSRLRVANIMISELDQ